MAYIVFESKDDAWLISVFENKDTWRISVFETEHDIEAGFEAQSRK